MEPTTKNAPQYSEAAQEAFKAEGYQLNEEHNRWENGSKCIVRAEGEEELYQTGTLAEAPEEQPVINHGTMSLEETVRSLKEQAS